MAVAPVRIAQVPDLRAIREDEMTLGGATAVLKKRWAIFLCIFAVFLAATTLYCLFATRRYEATGQIQIQKDSSGAFGLEGSVMGDAADSASDALDYNITLQTEANILNSESLALRVIQDLHLETTEDFYPPSKTRHERLLPPWLFFWKRPVEPLAVPLDHAPNRRYVVLKIFASHLKVETVTGTRLINVSYSSPDPRLAAEVVNHLTSALMDYSFQARFTATAQASNWLTTQLDDLRKQTEDLQAKAITLQRDTGMFGDDESHNVVLARLESLNEALAAAESNRILKEAVYRAARSGDPELISGLSGNASVGAVASMANSLSLIQNLRTQEATAKAELDEDKIRYGSAYPRIAEVQAELNGIEKEIQDEVHRIGERARTDYEIASRAETSARDAFEGQKKVVNALNDKAIAYGLAKQEADESRDVYEGLLAKLKQAGVLEGLRSTNITVVNPARVPPPNRPKSPNVLLYYAAAIVGGFIFGAGAAFLRDLSDTKVRSLEELERLTGNPLLGLIPEIRKGRTLSRNPCQTSALLYSKPSSDPQTFQIVSSTYISSPFVEALRSLRTSLMLSRSSKAPQVVLVTSSNAGEGKSTVSLNLATVLAQQGVRVLLVDADLRRPVLHARMGLQVQNGLSEALSSDHIHPQSLPSDKVPNLYVLCGGTVPPFPAELLASRRMRTLVARWRTEYDFVVMDGPPALPVTDAIVLEQLCDAVLLVARYGATEKKAIHRSHQILSRQLPEHVMLGTVLNAVPGRSSDFYEYYGYRSRTYNAEGVTNAAPE
ncbi:polysaccharide biosynthesis tyrosine autokinase [Alloacidobacterium dinghuense]|uniref:non-specific protein-tyrosine kinase n=1 Tax=Alloacidobacterium dinghuense TaxID=2763107 RepID=A0A7G8BJH7_9BACT|nr:polysaccharide biosynthesis tyrosine autokinase [Alloacidobacterium dinghuense]QNI32697.1 polysaccharide biosynthesis tyrosine autokinase [Alloacidobacterium dinghuense]